ncbi:sugar-transfer associated ATP-grasp domain-containing protein [Permianibacter aggregans]|uniref:Putative polysaccharide biosynthesis protein n=1 Tax=Permianibacter aggregans TaxID=1510150 RepID=A0A4R6UTM0_9GAMM|nr:sugar-transfer associated ATP-grasp domain-containing protein [Permianibacter aggregans]TDQ50492.1 putative polysaccharide biosynthesis protein [Permianibacter aggregans]
MAVLLQERKAPLVIRAFDTLVGRRLRLGKEILDVVHAKAAAGELPVWRQLGEMLVLKLFRRQTFRFYLYGRFWRRQMPWRDKWQHLNYREYAHLVDCSNDREYRRGFGNKLVQKALLSQRGLPTPRLLGLFHPAHGWRADGGALCTEADLASLLRELDDDHFACKMPDGYGGANFLAFYLENTANGLRLRHPISGETRTIADLCRQLSALPQGYLIERFQRQHPMLAEFNPSSLNTVRAWVYQNEQGSRLVGAYLRVGRRHALTDNISTGGMVCLLNPETGEMTELLSGDLGIRPLNAHPDTGFKPVGKCLPFWPELRALAEQTLLSFPRMHLTALDIAIGPDGPLIIEVNLEAPGQVGLARIDIPGRQLFPEVFADHAA